MRKAAFGLILILLFTIACSNTGSGETHENSSIQPPHTTNTPDQDLETLWPPVTGSDPSHRVGAFYYPWYFNQEFDGRWDHWGEGNFYPPLDIASDFYPVLGAYSVSDPAVLAQHFSWLREAGVGVIISSWWGKGDHTDRALPLMLDIAEHYGIKIAMHIEPYSERTAKSLAHLARMNYIPKAYAASKEIRDLRQLLRHREWMVNQRSKAKNRIHAVLAAYNLVSYVSPVTTYTFNVKYI